MDESPTISESREAFHSDLKDPRFKIFIVDFDNTLLLGNSTELFIDSALPRGVAWLLAFLGKGTAGLFFGTSPRFYRWCDFFRVGFVVCGLPWSLFLWRRSAPKLLNERLNARIFDALQQRPGSTIVIASFGFRQLIKPLVPEFPGGHILIASDLRPPFKNVRTQGKVAAVEERGIGLAGALAVSDSADDNDLLARTARGYRIEWEIKDLRPPAYFPLRFTAEGKYTPITFVWLFLKQDLPVILLAYFSGWEKLPLLFLLYIAFLTVYEMGYYENDFSAAKLEKSPALNPGSARFQVYGIHPWAWIWTLALTVGIGWLSSPHAALLWLGFLLVVRAVFYVYNKLPVQSRIPLYCVMQGGKYFGFWLVLTPCLTGIFLLAAQMARMIVPYMTYRLTGKDTCKAFHKIRFVVFFGLLILAGLFFWRTTAAQFLTVQAWLIAAWVCWKADQEMGLRWRVLGLVRKVRKILALICPALRK